MKGKTKNWKNWSGSLRFRPGEICQPESEEEISEIVKNASASGRKIRVVGAGHSSSALVETEDILLSLGHFKGVEAIDKAGHQATVLPGMTVKEAGKDLFRYGLAMHNTGDVDVQTLAGAISTGTHGTGKKLQNLSSMMSGARLVTGTGEIVEVSDKKDEEQMRAIRLSLGTCGIFLNMRVELSPAYQLFRKEWCVHIEDCLKNLEKLQEENRNFDFYWYPRSEMAKIRVMNTKEEEMPEITYGVLQRETMGDSHEILPRTRHLRFDEIEYALPAENGTACFQEIRKLVKAKFRKEVGWRVLYRTVKADDAFISPFSGRDSVTISLHHNAGLPFRDYFMAMEPVFRKYGGRPHWGKKHHLRAAELKEIYPHWDRFQAQRETMDPEGVFLTDYMKELLIIKK